MLSDDTYHKPSAQCSYCFKSIFTENKPTQPKPRGNTSRFHDMLKCLLKPICIRSRRKKKTITVPEKCSCTTVSHVTLNQSSDSMTFIDLPWIVPPKYHRNTNINAPENHWIFRTGWTPQPDPSALVNTGWCSHCGSCVKSDECPSCDWDTKEEKSVFL